MFRFLLIIVCFLIICKIGYGSMYGVLEIMLYLRYDLGWI